MLIGGCPLEEASEHGIHYGNKSFFLLVLLRDVAYVWYFSTNLHISVLQAQSRIRVQCNSFHLPIQQTSFFECHLI